MNQPNRHPPLQGGVNFRDFGGYATTDGGKVKWGKLFRSGHLAGLTDADHAHLDRLDLSVICDFRTDLENQGEPTRLPIHLQRRMVRFSIWPKSARSVEHIVQSMANGSISEAEIHEAQNIVYREFVREFTTAYATMFRHILTSQGRAFLIHCAGGKDRTGLGAALIQRILGVPQETVHADYDLTNQSENTTQFIRSLAKAGAAMAGITDPAEVNALFARFMPLFGARADSLEAAFQVIDEMAGSLDSYRRSALNVSDSERDQLRAWYLE